MKKPLMTALVAALLLGGCNDGSSRNEAAIDVAEEMAEDPFLPPEQVSEKLANDSAAQTAAGEIPASIPQIAYVYEFGFRIAAPEIPQLQNRHVEMCDALGPQGCRVIEMRSSGGEGDYAYGDLQLAVAADKARSFGAQLAQSAEAEGGEQISAAITGEDLSRQIVDTEARLRARTALRDRLMEVLQTRRGTVAELVEAERGVAQVNEEIDQARSWLNEMRGRVNFSRMNVHYESGARSAGGFMEPIRDAVGSIGMIFGTAIATIIVLLTIAVPVGLLIWGGLAIRKRLRNPAAVAASSAEQ